MGTDFDEIWDAIPGKDVKPEPTEAKPQKPQKPKAETRSPSPPAKPDPWGEMQPQEREPTVRLNVDISVSLNDALTEKARQLRKPKTELVRKLLEWALTQESE